MNPYFQDDSTSIYLGDSRDVLPSLPDASVNCCVTSPPYWNLRSYLPKDHPLKSREIGQEKTPDEFVAVMVSLFREVRRVLRDDGTCWINLGDSYNGSGKSRGSGGKGASSGKQTTNKGSYFEPSNPVTVEGLKPKDLVGIPWRVALALQEPYYTGKVADERDRVWLAAMIDAEGSINGTEYLTGGRIKTNISISITNTSVPIIDKCERLFPQDVKHIYEKSGASDRTCYRWDVEQMDVKALFIREIYPYIVAKRKQAIIGYTFLEMQRGLPSKKKGYLPEQQEQRSWLMAALSKLNAGKDVDLPDWVVEPPSLFEPGYYLRQDIIWSKINPMPESVLDRCSRAHEYIFMFSKKPQYFYDAAAIRNPPSPDLIQQVMDGYNGHDTKDFDGGGAQSASGTKGRIIEGMRKRVDKQSGHSKRHAGFNERWGHMTVAEQMAMGSNKRSVWNVATKPFPGAHFATFPPELITPCILAGCPVGGTVLDVFGGSGTTGVVAMENGRKSVLIDLNGDYAAMCKARTGAVTPWMTIDF